MTITDKVKELVAAPTAYEGAKKAGEDYLAAVGTAKQAEAAAALLKELKEDVGDIDGAIAFGSSETGKQILGSGAAAFVDNAKKAKAAGGKYCICPACQAGGYILDHADEL